MKTVSLKSRLHNTLLALPKIHRATSHRVGKESTWEIIAPNFGTRRGKGMGWEHSGSFEGTKVERVTLGEACQRLVEMRVWIEEWKRWRMEKVPIGEAWQGT